MPDSNPQTTMHPFERAGLGKAPFRSLGIIELVYQACPGAPVQAAGTCAYCATGIRYAVRVQSADGNEFKIGTDCAMKLYRDDNAKTDALLVAIHDERRRIQREQRHKREKEQLADGRAWFETARADLARLPHPQASKPFFAERTLADYVEWMQRHAGISGQLSAYRQARKALERITSNG